MEQLIQAKPILLQVIFESDLKTLLSLRLTSKAIYDLITAYEASISKCVAERCFPNPTLLLRPPGCWEPSIKWLLELQHRATVVPRLSALVVDYNQPGFVGYNSIPAWDPKGDDLRARVNNGWYILWYLSDIAEFTQAAERMVEPRRYFGLGPRQITLVHKEEAEILARRLEFLDKLELGQMEDYDILHSFLTAAFQYSNLCDLTESGWGYRNGTLPPSFYRGDSWLYWYVLRVGPRLFSQAWGSDFENDTAIGNIRDEWRARSRKRIGIERSFAQPIRRKFQVGVWDSLCYRWVSEFIDGYWHNRSAAGGYKDPPQYVGQSSEVRFKIQ